MSLKYTISVPAVVAEYYSASAVERAVVFCIFDFHMISALLYNRSVPDVDRREQLFSQFALV